MKGDGTEREALVGKGWSSFSMSDGTPEGKVLLLIHEPVPSGSQVEIKLSRARARVLLML